MSNKYTEPVNSILENMTDSEGRLVFGDFNKLHLVSGLDKSAHIQSCVKMLSDLEYFTPEQSSFFYGAYDSNSNRLDALRQFFYTGTTDHLITMESLAGELAIVNAPITVPDMLNVVSDSIAKMLNVEVGQTILVNRENLWSLRSLLDIASKHSGIEIYKVRRIHLAVTELTSPVDRLAYWLQLDSKHSKHNAGSYQVKTRGGKVDNVSWYGSAITGRERGESGANVIESLYITLQGESNRLYTFVVAGKLSGLLTRIA